MNQRRGRKRKLADAHAAELRLLPYDREKMAALPSHTRYTFALMANIFHDALLLERFIARSEPRAKMPEYVKAAQVAQSMVLARILGAKVWEADIRLGTEPAATQLREEFSPAVPGDAEAQLRAEISAANWLGRLRSAHAFHYPKYSQIGIHLDQRWVHGAGTILGETQGNTFHYEADQALMLALFASMVDACGEPIPADSAELARSFERLIDELFAHSVQQSTQIGRLLLVFIERRLMGADPAVEIRPLGNIDGPEFATFFLPFFMSARKRD